MGSTTKRAWKLDEFVAHGGNVNCIALGHKSGRVMVTGGDDKKVNMWCVGKPNCIMSLQGHTSPVTAVRFSQEEDVVVAGSQSGALKIWGLEQAKIVRTLTGHKSAIKSLDFHPYGDFVASGSLDTNMKLWDIRRKGCIFTYKGHTDAINCIRFSPDGRWITTAGEDGVLKMWDLTAGKLLSDFNLHSGPVNAVEFHPSEFLLASASSDRTVKFWDLESFQLVSSTDGDSGPIRCIWFHPEGSCLYTGSQDLIKVYGWEPARCYDSVSVGWGKVVDIALTSNQLIGATFSQSNVSTYVADISRLQPLGGPVHSPPSNVPGPPMSASGRRSFSERPLTQSSRQQPVSPKEEPEDQGGGADEDPAQNPADITNPEDYNNIFHPGKTLARSPPKNPDPFPAPPDDGCAAEPVPVARAPPAQPAPARVTSAPKAQPPAAFQPPPAAEQPPVQRQAAASSKPPAARPPSSQSTNNRQPPPSSSSASSRQTSSSSNSSRPNSNGSRPPSSSKKAEISADDFLPAPYAVGGNAGSFNMSEGDALSTILKGHDSMIAVMNSRGKNLQIVRALYSGGNMRTAMESAIGMNDKAIIVDLFNVMIQRHSLWNLDLCALAVPQIEELLNSKYENYMNSACSALKLILKNFASVIKANLTAPPSLGVDIMREERYNKCKRCYQQLMNIRSTLNEKVAMKGELGTKYREVQLLMAQLD